MLRLHEGPHKTLMTIRAAHCDEPPVFECGTHRWLAVDHDGCDCRHRHYICLMCGDLMTKTLERRKAY